MLQERVNKFFNLDQFVDLLRITSELQDNIGNTKISKLTKQELDLLEILTIWGRTKSGMNQLAIGLIPCEKTIYIGGVEDLQLATLNHYATELVRDIGVMFKLKEYYHPIIKDVLNNIVLNLEAMDQ